MLETFNPTKLLNGYKLSKWRQKLHVLLGNSEKEFLQFCFFFFFSNWQTENVNKTDYSLFSFVPFVPFQPCFKIETFLGIKR